MIPRQVGIGFGGVTSGALVDQVAHAVRVALDAARRVAHDRASRRLARRLRRMGRG